jgi:uncharacterized protein YheU (UPF0270 family)
MEIPYEMLPPDTLRAVLEEFVTREGTDYGEQSFSLDQKVAQVMAQLKRRQAIIVFDEATESCHVVPQS